MTAAAQETTGKTTAKIHRFEPMNAATMGKKNPASQSAGQTTLTPGSRRIQALR
jgi:hypothetical protein